MVKKIINLLSEQEKNNNKRLLDATILAYEEILNGYGNTKEGYNESKILTQREKYGANLLAQKKEKYWTSLNYTP